MKKSLKNNLKKIQDNISQLSSENKKITILAASKSQPIELIDEAINCNVFCFGESKVQEAEQKFINKRNKIDLHLIGHLQTNKVKKAVKLFNTIQTVDTLRVAEKINSVAHTINKRQQIYCQINIGEDENKKGFKLLDFEQEIKKILNLKNIKLKGLMTILPRNIDFEKKEKLYQKMKTLKNKIEHKHKVTLELSMGMSNDYIVAIQNGATVVRIGTGVFGKRTAL